MKLVDITNDRIVKLAVLEDWMSSDLSRTVNNGGILIEMANLKPRITDLPANIILWTRAQPLELPHTKYRVKVTKDHKHSVSYSVSNEPKIVEKYSVGKKYKLDSYEQQEIIKFIQHFYPLLISYIDAKIDANELEYQIQKINKS